MAKTIDDYKRDYYTAQEKGDYIGMQVAHDAANEIRLANGEAPTDATNAINAVKNAATQNPAPQQQTVPAQQQYSYGGSAPAQSYDPTSDSAYMQAIAALKNVQGQMPQYANSYDGQLNDLYNQIVNRPKFQYDINGDLLYKQYADQYVQKGRLAMQDTMGQAAALTGGYGSTYGQAVGQQQYDAYLQQLNGVIPELYGQAYDRWKDEGDRLVQNYTLLGDLADDEYKKYGDAYNRWLTERGYYQDAADQAYQRGYNDWANQWDQYNRDRAFDYDVYRDSVSDQRYAEETAYAKEQDALDRQTAYEKFVYQQNQDALDRQAADEKFAYQKEQDALDRQAAADKLAYQQSLDDYERQLASANALAKAGDYSGLADIYGWTPDQLAGINNVDETDAAVYQIPVKQYETSVTGAASGDTSSYGHGNAVPIRNASTDMYSQLQSVNSINNQFRQSNGLTVNNVGTKYKVSALQDIAYAISNGVDAATAQAMIDDAAKEGLLPGDELMYAKNLLNRYYK